MAIKDRVRIRKSIYATLAFILVIWIVKILEYSIDYDLGYLGIFPRTFEGSIGIITAPLVHGDFYHLLSNTFPLLFLGLAITYFYDKIAGTVLILIYFMTGFWVWLAARDAYHIGASGLVYGMLTFLLFSGFFRKDTRALAVSFIVLFLYGGTFATGLVPTDAAISWESHLMGAVAGLFCAIYFKNSKLTLDSSNEMSEELETVKTNTSPTVYTYVYIEENQKKESSTYTVKSDNNHTNFTNTSLKE